MVILNTLEQLKEITGKQKFSKFIVITTEKVAAVTEWALTTISTLGELEIIYIPDGEAAKEWEVFEKLLASLIDKKADKNTLIIALGGGTVGDITGFASSIYRRGIAYVQVPTTLLAQVDSAHGSKTGINFKSYKNVLGSVYDPIAVVIDYRFTEHLPPQLIIDGLGEILKYGLIKDPKILRMLKDFKLDDPESRKVLKEIIQICPKIKYKFTKADRNDNGIRQTLNFGHTIGHAVELKYKLSHGVAVLVGMIKELELGEKLGVTSVEVKKDLIKLLEVMNIPVNVNYEPDWESIEKDKKVRNNILTLPLIKKPGKTVLVPIDLRKLKTLIY